MDKSKIAIAFSYVVIMLIGVLLGLGITRREIETLKQADAELKYSNENLLNADKALKAADKALVDSHMALERELDSLYTRFPACMRERAPRWQSH